jgi:hypothetical protein
MRSRVHHRSGVGIGRDGFSKEITLSRDLKEVREEPCEYLRKKNSRQPVWSVQRP